MNALDHDCCGRRSHQEWQFSKWSLFKSMSQRLKISKKNLRNTAIGATANVTKIMNKTKEEDIPQHSESLGWRN